VSAEIAIVEQNHRSFPNSYLQPRRHFRHTISSASPDQSPLLAKISLSFAAMRYIVDQQAVIVASHQPCTSRRRMAKAQRTTTF
jgi:hypothetical protein